jgi:hydroxymethylpyrimidine/phosphomethylpyrimidine kinase
MMARASVLVVAGSDSSGGAGIARDVATLAHFGVGGSLAITAITVQTHAAVIAVETTAASLVAAQMRAALEANSIGAIKIGMLATAGTVLAVSDVLAENAGIPTVLDPVLASSSGSQLLSDPGIEALRRQLLAKAALVTPNLPELGILTGRHAARSDAEIKDQAAQLLDMGCSSVLVKGGHGEGLQSTDTLFRWRKRPERFASLRRSGTLRGTGCMLSSAIAANLAMGHDLPASIAAAKTFIDAIFDAERDQ